MKGGGLAEFSGGFGPSGFRSAGLWSQMRTVLKPADMGVMRDAIARRRKVRFRTFKDSYVGEPHAMIVDRLCRGPVVLLWAQAASGAEGWKRICMADIHDLELVPESFLARMRPVRW